jgi:hypothetical protein
MLSKLNIGFDEGNLHQSDPKPKQDTLRQKILVVAFAQANHHHAGYIDDSTDDK